MVPPASGAAAGRVPQTFEDRFERLLRLPRLDHAVARDPTLRRSIERPLGEAIRRAWGPGTAGGEAALLPHRVLYRIHRLKLFWYDDLASYENERSRWLDDIRERIEDAWQRAELARHDVAALRAEDVVEGLRRRAAADLDPPPTRDQRYVRDRTGLAGYRRLVEIASLDGLVEASQLSRVLGGAADPVQSMLTRVFVEEYGGGKLARKHSSFFAAMLAALDLRAEPEAYFASVPADVLASINQSFVLSERRRFFLRYVGGLTYFEVSVPAAFRHYVAAAERLGLSTAARAYWSLHVEEDERHGRWMIDDVAVPLARRYPRDAWEILLGYDQQRDLSARAGAAVVERMRAADRAAARAP